MSEPLKPSGELSYAHALSFSPSLEEKGQGDGERASLSASPQEVNDVAREASARLAALGQTPSAIPRELNKKQVENFVEQSVPEKIRDRQKVVRDISRAVLGKPPYERGPHLIPIVITYLLPGFLSDPKFIATLSSEPLRQALDPKGHRETLEHNRALVLQQAILFMQSWNPAAINQIFGKPENLADVLVWNVYPEVTGNLHRYDPAAAARARAEEVVAPPVAHAARELRDNVRWLGFAEDARTVYGKWRRGEKADWDLHLEQNRKGILKAASLVDRKGKGDPDPEKRPVVMILGAGYGMDIPLKELVRDFKVILVDHDENGPRESISRLSPDKRKYVSIEVRDISGGVVNRITTASRKILSETDDPEKAYELFQAMIAREMEEMDVCDLAGKSRADLLVSTMLISQMGVEPTFRFQMEFAKKFGADALPKSEFNELTNLFDSTLQAAHAYGLAQFVEQTGGVAYYASDVFLHHPSHTEPIVVVPFQGGHLGDSFIDGRGYTNITAAEKMEWKWTESSSNGSRTVHAVIITPTPKPGITPRPGSLDATSPYRYPRMVEARPENVEAAERDWRSVLNEGALKGETDRTRKLSETQKKNEALARLGIGDDDALLGQTFFNNMAQVYDVLESGLGKADSSFPLAVGSFGAGSINMTSLDGRWGHVALSALRCYYNLPMLLMTVEPYEILMTLLYRHRNGTLDVYDIDPQVIKALSHPTGEIIWPTFGAGGEPLYKPDGTPGDSPNAQFIQRFLERAAPQGAKVLSLEEAARNTSGWPNRHPNAGDRAFHFTLGREHLQKLNPHSIDLGTDLIPEQNRKLHVGFYLQTAYFMDPILQRAAFIKIVNQFHDYGLLVSDYLLTDAEAELLGLKVLKRLYKKGLEEAPPTAGAERDRTLAIYQKTSQAPFVDEMMQVITRVQGVSGLLAQAAQWLEVSEERQRGVAGANPTDFPRYRQDQESAASLITGKGIIGHESADQRPTVMVLGAGEDWSRLMLKDWAGKYKIILVDLDERKLKQAVDRLPEPLRKYVFTDCRDITGGVAVAFVAGAKRILKESRTPEEAVQRLVTMLGDLWNATPSAGFFPETSKVDMVISPMLMGYLGTHLTSTFFEAYKAKFHADLPQNSAASKIVRSFLGQVMKAHIRALAALAKQTGALVYLTDMVKSWAKMGNAAEAMIFLLDENGNELAYLEDYLAGFKGVTVTQRVDPWVYDILPGVMDTTVETLVFSSAALAALPQKVAQSMEDHPEIYWEHSCFKNIYDLIRINKEAFLAPETRVLFLVPHTTKTKQSLMSGAGFIPLAPTCETGPWAFHAVLEVDGRIFDWDYAGEPGQPTADYLSGQFGDRQMDIVAVPVIEFMQRAQVLLEMGHLFSGEYQRLTAENYLAELKQRAGSQERLENLKPRKEVYDRHPLVLHAEIKGDTLFVCYERTLGGEFNIFSVLQSLEGVGHVPQGTSVTKMDVTVSVPAGTQFEPVRDISERVRAFLEQSGFNGALEFTLRAGDETKLRRKFARSLIVGRAPLWGWRRPVAVGTSVADFNQLYNAILTTDRRREFLDDDQWRKFSKAADEGMVTDLCRKHPNIHDGLLKALADPAVQKYLVLHGGHEIFILALTGKKKSPLPSGGIKGGGGGVQMDDGVQLAVEDDLTSSPETAHQTSSYHHLARRPGTLVPTLGTGRFTPTGRSAFRAFVP